MPKHLVLEEEKKVIPPILLIDTNPGIRNTLLNLLANELSSQGKLYALSSKEVPVGVERISPLSIHLLDKLSDQLKYAVIFLDEESQKKKVLSIIEKLSVQKTRIVIIIPYRVIERFIDILLRVKDEKQVIVGMVGDVFGKSNLSSPLSKIIQNALVHKEILLSGNELLSVYPILDRDVIQGIQFLLFTKNVSPFYNLFYEHPETLISLSHLMKRHEPELSIQFKNIDLGLASEKTQMEKDKYIKDRTTVKPIFLSHVLLGFEKSVEVFDSHIEYTSQSKKKLKVFKERSKFSGAWRFVRYAVMAFMLYAIITLLLFLGSIVLLKEGVAKLSSGNTKEAERFLTISSKLYMVTRNTIFLFSIFPSNLTHGKLDDELKSYEGLSKVAIEVIPIIKKAQTANPTLDKKELENLTASVLKLYFILERNNIPQLKPFVSSEAFKKSSSLFSVLQIAPTFMGYDSPKHYLILFQNDSELRPTGGFIGSVGYATVQNGEVVDLTIQDVYDLDGQLKGHIEPPYIIRRFLQPHLYLRDSNFAPDFAETASTAALLYNLESGKKIDGVIAIDTQVLKKVLSVTGPIKISESEVVNSTNVVTLLEGTIQKDFFPGSTKKKETLRTLLNKITVIFETDKAKQLSLLKSLPSLLSEKHILLSFASPSIQKVFVGASLAGSMSDLRIEAHTLRDFLSVNEANIGVNKANKHITRKITYSAFLKPTVLNSDVLLEYTNKGEDPYMAYIRLIIPKDSRVLSIRIDGADQKIVPAITNPATYEKKNFKAPIGALEVDQVTDLNYHTVGFVTTIPVNTTSRIRVLYENTRIVPVEDIFTYSLLFIKQPGTLSYPLTVQLQTEGNYTIKNKDGTSPILYDDNIFQDREIKTNVTRVKK